MRAIVLFSLLSPCHHILTLHSSFCSSPHVGAHFLTVWKRSGKKTICVDLLSNSPNQESPRGIRKVRHLPGGAFFVTLNSDDSLSFWDSKKYVVSSPSCLRFLFQYPKVFLVSLLPFRLIEIRRLTTSHFLDFHLAPFGENTDSTATIVALSLSGETHCLELYAAPTFQRLYTLEVSPSSVLSPSAQTVLCPSTSGYLPTCV